MRCSKSSTPREGPDPYEHWVREQATGSCRGTAGKSFWVMTAVLYLWSVERYGVNQIGESFHIDGFPDAVKLVSLDEVSPQRARELSQITSCRVDLVFARSCLDLLRTTQKPSSLVQAALWRGAIVYYCKCFAQRGPRRPLPFTKILPFMRDTEVQPREIHKHFMALRNKHIVHDENAWLQVLTGAVIAPPGKGYNVEKVICTTFEGQTLDSGGFGNLYLLIEHALAWVERRFDALCAEITAELEQLPRDTLLSQPALKYRAPEAKDVHVPRSEG